MSPGAPRIQEGQMYKVPPSVGMGKSGLSMNSVVRIARTPETGDPEVDVRQPDESGTILQVSRNVIRELSRIVPIKAGDSFRIPGNIEVPPFLREKGINAKTVVTVCEDPSPINPGGLIDVKAGDGVKFSILADVLSGFNRKRRKKSSKKG